MSAALVKELRERTGLGLLECKKALAEADGDIEAAIDSSHIESRSLRTCTLCLADMGEAHEPRERSVGRISMLRFRFGLRVRIDTSFSLPSTLPALPSSC